MDMMSVMQNYWNSTVQLAGSKSDLRETQIHEDTVSPVWGTPDMDSSLFQLKMPVLAISKPVGERILEKLEQYQQDGENTVCRS